eukprot:CAMPEP_0197017378 /NCGR_PEP_ID=MMETSP1380-20130617/79509_1 /TAXON_ID=5936 /ORGANISM="Euplotes crassus, Strain CT5" /LENGTH=608 /DNA_ID=CAMNT_0042444471 /DNA_START=190 /DNA_END=2016 /DNA_ORIENTATION=-
MMFDICGIFQNMFGGVNILILIARVSRVGLYYFLVANFESDKVKEKRQALQNEISQIKKETDLNAILKKLDDKCENTDEVLKAAIQKGIEVHNDNRRKKKVRHGLLKASFMRDDTEVDPTRINEVKLKDINRIIDSIDDHQEEFFNDDFNFLTMEDQYDLKMLLDSSEDLEFDVFDLKNQTNGNEMYVFGMHIMTKEAYLEEYRIDKMKLQNFLYAIQESYNPVAYHNKTHATDVSQTVYYFMKSCDVIDICKLSRTEQMSMLLAGFMQDVDHPGYTNSFLINTNDPLSLRYNDKSVLENYHIAMAFKIMKGCEQCDIFDKVSMKQNREIRKLIVNFILATDMANHFSKMFALEQRSSEDDFDPAGIDKEITTEFIFHVADINTSKPWPVCKKWVDMLFIEFFNQGDREKEIGLEVSYLMDRETINVAESQDMFINNMIKPAFVILEQFIPNLSQNLRNLDDNLEKWKKKIPQYAIGVHAHKETRKQTEGDSRKSRTPVKEEIDMIEEVESEHEVVKEEVQAVEAPQNEEDVKAIEINLQEEKEIEKELEKEENGYISDDSYVPSEYTPYLSSRKNSRPKEFGIYQVPRQMETNTKKKMSGVLSRKTR